MAAYGRTSLVGTVIILNIYYLADWGSDIFSSIDSIRSGEHSKGIITIGTNLIAAYVLAILHRHWNRKDYGRGEWHLIIYILPFALLFQYFRALALLLPVIFYPQLVEKIEDKVHRQLLLEDWKAVKLALIQTVVPNLLQFVWHFQPIFDSINKEITLKQTETALLVCSFLACAIGLSTYQHHRRLILSQLRNEDRKSQFLLQILTYVSTFLNLAARFIAVTAAINSSSLWVFVLVVVGLHYVISWMFIHWQDLDGFHHAKDTTTNEVDEPDGPELILVPVVQEVISKVEEKFCHWLGKLLLSFILLAAHLEDKHKYTLSILYLMENLSFIAGWIYILNDRSTWDWAVFSIVVTINICGVLVNFLIWKLFFKSQSKVYAKGEDGHQNSEPSLQMDDLIQVPQKFEDSSNVDNRC